MAFQKEEVYEDLRNGIFNIRFQKSDGSIRTLKASLQKGVVPDSVEQIANKQMQLDTGGNDRNIIRVWSLDDMGWRSIRVTHIDKMEVV
jgi:hypothetical protein